MDTFIITAMFASWILVWERYAEKRMKKGKKTITLVLYLFYMIITYLIAYSLTTVL